MLLGLHYSNVSCFLTLSVPGAIKVPEKCKHRFKGTLVTLGVSKERWANASMTDDEAPTLR